MTEEDSSSPSCSLRPPGPAVAAETARGVSAVVVSSAAAASAVVSSSVPQKARYPRFSSRCSATPSSSIRAALCVAWAKKVMRAGVVPEIMVPQLPSWSVRSITSPSLVPDAPPSRVGSYPAETTRSESLARNSVRTTRASLDGQGGASAAQGSFLLGTAWPVSMRVEKSAAVRMHISSSPEHSTHLLGLCSSSRLAVPALDRPARRRLAFFSRRVPVPVPLGLDPAGLEPVGAGPVPLEPLPPLPPFPVPLPGGPVPSSRITPIPTGGFSLGGPQHLTHCGPFRNMVSASASAPSLRRREDAAARLVIRAASTGAGPVVAEEKARRAEKATRPVVVVFFIIAGRRLVVLLLLLVDGRDAIVACLLRTQFK
mmetsp:Transcript_33561/g.98885  ORF Transcript_33561/g.98885 Transcript_33561/m.98885 type:complete len:371 (-) Transcript_33561:184-1296(-)